MAVEIEYMDHGDFVTGALVACECMLREARRCGRADEPNLSDMLEALHRLGVDVPADIPECGIAKADLNELAGLLTPPEGGWR